MSTVSRLWLEIQSSLGMRKSVGTAIANCIYIYNIIWWHIFLWNTLALESMDVKTCVLIFNVPYGKRTDLTPKAHRTVCRTYRYCGCGQCFNETLPKRKCLPAYDLLTLPLQSHWKWKFQVHALSRPCYGKFHAISSCSASIQVSI